MFCLLSSQSQVTGWRPSHVPAISTGPDNSPGSPESLRSRKPAKKSGVRRKWARGKHRHQTSACVSVCLPFLSWANAIYSVFASDFCRNKFGWKQTRTSGNILSSARKESICFNRFDFYLTIFFIDQETILYPDDTFFEEVITFYFSLGETLPSLNLLCVLLSINC